MLEHEFQFFKSGSNLSFYKIVLELSDIPKGLLPKLMATKISQNSVTFDDSQVRWNDYFGKALSYLNYQTGQAAIYTPDIDLMHEIAYLLILSLSGKRMDLKGFHKIHACGINIHQKNILVMLPSKGGKTTLFLELCEHYPVALISDDTPVVDNRGIIHPFPLRVGVENRPQWLQDQDFPLFKREHFSDKFLIPLTHLKRPIAQVNNDPAVLVIGVRANGDIPQIYPASFLTSFKSLFENMIIGIGLPMVVEYFVKNTWRDWIYLTGIFFKRIGAALNLWRRSKTYVFVMSTDPKLNAQFLMSRIQDL